MPRVLIAALAIAGCALILPASAQQDQAVTGVWRGPWYRGMTSGVVTIELRAGGEGTIQFTNLENFGEEPAALEDVELKGKAIAFTASGKSGAAFTAKATVSADGAKMLGNARYEGFGVRFEARPAKD